MGITKVLCLFGIVLLTTSAYARKHDARGKHRLRHVRSLFRSHIRVQDEPRLVKRQVKQGRLEETVREGEVSEPLPARAGRKPGVAQSQSLSQNPLLQAGHKRQSPQLVIQRTPPPQPVTPTDPLPDFAEFQSNRVTNGQSFLIATGCTVTASKTGTLWQIRADPPDCVNLAVLLQHVLPEGKVHFDSSTFMTLEKIIIRSLSLDTATKGVEIVAAYTGTATLIKDILTLSNIRVGLSFVWTRSQKFTFDIGATFTIGSVPIDVRLVRNEVGYYLTAQAEVNFNVTTIRHLFQEKDTFLPSSCLQNQLEIARFNTFTIINPRLRATFADGYGFLFAGSIRILDWEPFDVNVLINKPNDSPTSVTIAVYTQSFSIKKMFLDLFEIDLTGVPVLGTVVVRNLAFSLSTGDVEVPLTVLDIGSEAIFDIPYRKGLKVSFEVDVAGVYVATSIFISPTVLSLSISQNGELTLGKVITAFIPGAGITTGSGSSTTLNGWPSFIHQFNPLDIALVLFYMEASKTGSSWGLSQLNLKLKKEQEITLFSNLIHISNLEFDLNYQKVGSAPASISGLILGRVALGAKTGGVAKSPTVDIRIPFPFANQEISFTFTDFSVKNVVEAIATGFEFPVDFPELLEHIQLDKIAIQFGGTSDVTQISVDASIPGLWRVFGSFSIGNVGIHFEYGKNQANPSAAKRWLLRVRGELVISTCNITVAAEIGSDMVELSAEGTRCSASVGDLLEKIHLNGRILPPIIAGFTIFDPKLAFKWVRKTDRTQGPGEKSIAFSATTSLFHRSEVEFALINRESKTAVIAGFAIQEDALSQLEFLKPLGLTDLAIVFVSQKIALAPYEFQNKVFKRYIVGTPEFTGVTIYARFAPKADSVLGKLLRNGINQDDNLKPTGGAEPSIVCKIRFPKLLFELDINIPNGITLIGSLKFIQMKLIVSTSMIGLSLKCNVTLDGEPSSFTGALTLSFSGTVTISLLWEGTWHNPFGISSALTIRRMGLALGINIDLVPSFGITGAITVDVPGDDPPIDVDLTLCIDPSNPQATVFELHFTRLLLKDIINMFAGTVVNLPDKLADVGFPDEVQLYFSPQGNPLCFGRSYEAGLEIHGTLAIPFLKIRARIDLSIVLPPNQFKLNASLVLDPVIYLNGLIKIVDADSDTVGAHLKMYITENIAELRIDGSCRIEIFGAMISVNLKIDSTRFFFEGRLNLWNLFQVYILVDIKMSGTDPSLHVVGEMQNDLFAKLKQKASQGIQSGAREINRRIEAAQQKILNAEREVNKLQGYIDYHKRKISEARHDCSRAPWYKKIWVCIATGFRIVYHGGIIATLWIAHGVAIGVLEAARYFLKGVQVIIKVGAAVLQTLVNAALSIIDIQYVKFEVFLNRVHKVFNFNARIVILGWTFTPSFSIDFSTSSSANAGINSAGGTISKNTLDQVRK